jgi:membrane protein DedA with SNARE-associated domain
VGGATHTLTTWIGDYGLYAVFGLMLIDAVFPAASELVMLYAGVLAVGAVSGHHVTAFGAVLESTGPAYVAIATAGVLGYTLGSVFGWAVGLYGGRALLERHGRWLHLMPENLDRAEAWFARYGDATVFVGRMVPVARSFISIPAGVAEMPFARYTLLSFLGTIPWCFGLAAAGLALGTGWERFHVRFRYADYAVAALVVLGVLVVLARAGRKRAANRSV